MSVSPRFLTDEQLIAQCRVETIRGSGPGGQKRNKTSSMVRMTHVPTGIHVVAGESRSQSQNKTMALRRLRLKMAIELREQVDIKRFEPPDWFTLDVSGRNPLYPAIAGLLLDVFTLLDANPARTAAMLGASTSAVVRLLEDEPQLWIEANRLRKESGQQPLAHRR